MSRRASHTPRRDSCTPRHASVSSALPSSHTPCAELANAGPQDAAERARELYKYFQPEDFKKEAEREGTTRHDTTLAAYAQHVALRLNMRRCFITTFDKDTQYILAESTRTLDLEDLSRADDPQDALWLGPGASVADIHDSICLYTLKALPNEAFEVLDVLQDSRFATISCVMATPHVRHYLGVPLKTKRGLAIGTLYLVDEKPGKAISQDQQRFLQTMAKNVMRYLELLRERAERRRSLKMNKYLSLFVNPSTDIDDSKSRVARLAKHRRVLSGSSRMETYDVSQSSTSRRRMTNDSASEADSVKSDSSKTGKSDTKSSTQKDDPHRNLKIFREAARLLLKSLELETEGGVVFMDCRSRINDGLASEMKAGRRQSIAPLQRRGSMAVVQNGEVLAWSTSKSPRGKARPSSIDKEEDDEATFSALSVDVLNTLITRYPQGKLWVFDASGSVMSDSEGDSPSGDYRLQAEAAILRQSFPAATQIMSVPIWDPGLSRWSVCFVYNTSKFKFFSVETDLLFVIAFCSCITIELARLASIAADQLKSDFISSISHELRSPLHGILASCEFLQDTEASAFQQSLVHTVTSCAKTLLDTISMVLDYSKINAFERNFKRAAKSKKGISHTMNMGADGSLPTQGQAMLNIYGNVDLAAITEEVVESTTAGSMYQDLSRMEINDLGAKARGRTGDRGQAQTAKDLAESLNPPATGRESGHVEVILDIKAKSNWSYVTQPGAFRRIVMNLVGNALKYTQSGWIKISLDTVSTNSSAADGTQDGVTDVIVFTVEDTGKGISAEYLQNKLFQAFAQEDHLAIGTGLGLSLVKSILTLLNGEISITSTVGHGTIVTVTIPMIQASTANPSNSTTPSTGSSDTLKDDSVTAIRKTAIDLTVSIYPSGAQSLSMTADRLDCTADLREKLALYVTEWCTFTLVPWTTKCAADLVITDETDLGEYLGITKAKDATRLDQPLLVLCSNASHHDLLITQSHIDGIQLMSKPFGPYKLARALRLCLERKSGAVSRAFTSLPERGLPVLEEVAEAVPLIEEEVTLPSSQGDIKVIESGSIMAKSDSANAGLAMHADYEQPTSTSGGTGSANEGMEFPFATVSTDKTSPPLSPPHLHPISAELVASPRIALRPDLRNRRTMSPTVSEMVQIERHVAIDSALHAMTPAGISATGAASVGQTPKIDPIPAQKSQSSAAQRREPTVLLVDDNTINLRLLTMFMKKRKYTSILSARDGLEAVNAYSSALHSNPSAPPDIVFMDISMPVMDGFEATRQIRALESQNADEHSPTDRPASALIIALTGLASGKDQSEAFLAGVDLYMTKPVSFKEVGRLLDNWEKNAGAHDAAAAVALEIHEAAGSTESESVPRGALTFRMSEALREREAEE